MGGGGGGGGGRTGLGNINAIVEKAREEVRKAEAGERRNVFLSFAYEDVDEVNLLRGQAKNARSDIEFNDWSVREPYESTRADYIRQKIAQCSLTVVYVSAETASSKWVAWEVDESIRRGKKVIAVHKGESAPASLPAIVKAKRIPVVPWSGLADAIDRL
jgi:hypothetical protein